MENWKVRPTFMQHSCSAALKKTFSRWWVQVMMELKHNYSTCTRIYKNNMWERQIDNEIMLESWVTQQQRCKKKKDLQAHTDFCMYVQGLMHIFPSQCMCVCTRLVVSNSPQPTSEEKLSAYIHHIGFLSFSQVSTQNSSWPQRSDREK